VIACGVDGEGFGPCMVVSMAAMARGLSMLHGMLSTCHRGAYYMGWLQGMCASHMLLVWAAFWGFSVAQIACMLLPLFIHVQTCLWRAVHAPWLV
jgi:hypothetical protein